MSDVRDVTTDAGLPVREVYTADDVAPDLDARLGVPGAPPYTRGPYGSMYRGRLWTMRDELEEPLHWVISWTTESPDAQTPGNAPSPPDRVPGRS